MVSRIYHADRGGSCPTTSTRGKLSGEEQRIDQTGLFSVSKVSSIFKFLIVSMVRDRSTEREVFHEFFLERVIVRVINILQFSQERSWIHAYAHPEERGAERLHIGPVQQAI